MARFQIYFFSLSSSPYIKTQRIRMIYISGREGGWGWEELPPSPLFPIATPLDVSVLLQIWNFLCRYDLLSLLREYIGLIPDVLYKKDLQELLNIAAKYNLNISDSHCVVKHKKHKIWYYYIEHSLNL